MPRWPKKQVEHELREADLRTRAQVTGILTEREDALLMVVESVEKLTAAVTLMARAMGALGGEAPRVPVNGAVGQHYEAAPPEPPVTEPEPPTLPDAPPDEEEEKDDEDEEGEAGEEGEEGEEEDDAPGVQTTFE